jgi:hypothetical protein
MTPHQGLVKHQVGRPRVSVNSQQVLHLRSEGASWRQISKALGIGTATAMRLLRLGDEARPNTQHVSPKTVDELT